MRSSIKQTYLYKLFKEWEKNTRNDFPFRIYFSHSTRSGITYKISGISKVRITCNASGIDIWITSDKNFKIRKNLDILYSFDIMERKAKNGHYCDLCQGRPKYFKSRDDLWYDHVFDPLKEWLLQSISYDKYICSYGTSENYYSMRLLTKDELKKRKNKQDLRQVDKLFKITN